MSEHPILFSGPMVRAILEGRKTQTRRVIKPQPKRIADDEYDGGWKLEWYRGNRLSQTIAEPCMGREVYQAELAKSLCPYGIPGDRLWVRETWGEFDTDHYYDPMRPREELRTRDVQVNGIWAPVRNGCYYKADCVSADSERCRLDFGYKYKPSIHMPRWACRLILEVKSVRVERVQEISEEDAIAEGIKVLIGPYSRQYAGGQQQWYRNPIDAFKQIWDSINLKRGCGWEANPWVWVVDYMRTVQP